MNKFGLVGVFLLMSLGIMAQTSTLSGFVANEKGEGIFAVNVYLKNLPTVGTVTGLDGTFVINIASSLLTDKTQLVFSFIGYKTVERSINPDDSSKCLYVVLKESEHTLSEVKVEANQSITREFAIKDFDKLSIYLSPLASADPLKAIASLPSSTNTSETANPELRGSSANRSKVFFNGVPIDNPVRNSQMNGIGFFSLINPEMIKTMQVYASNPPLIYGNSSAGLIDIETNSKLDNNQTQITLSLASLGINVARKTGKKSFVQAYANQMLSDGYLWLNPVLKNKINRFKSTDGGINYHIELTDNWSFNLFNYAVSEKSAIKLNLFTWPGLANATTDRDFSIVNLKFNQRSLLVALNLGTNFSKSGFDFGNILTENRQQSQYCSLHIKYLPITTIKLQAGFANNYSSSRFSNQLPVYYFALSPESPSYSINYSLQKNLTETYFYTNFTPTDKLIFGIGERNQWETYDGIKIPNFAIQTNLRCNLSKNQSLLLAAGQYYNIAEPVYDQWIYKTLKSKQLSVDYQYSSNIASINLVGYLKNETGDSVGCRTIKGTEIYFDYNIGRYFKASFSNTILYNDSGVFNETQDNFDQTGYFCLGTLSYSNPGIFNLALALNWRKGKTLTLINESRFNNETGFYEPDYFTRSRTRLPNYTTIHISISKLIGLWQGTAIIFGSVNNVFNIKNKKSLVYATDYSSATFDYYQLRSFYLGVMYSF